MKGKGNSFAGGPAPCLGTVGKVRAAAPSAQGAEGAGGLGRSEG